MIDEDDAPEGHKAVPYYGGMGICGGYAFRTDCLSYDWADLACCDENRKDGRDDRMRVIFMENDK